LCADIVLSIEHDVVYSTVTNYSCSIYWLKRSHVTFSTIRCFVVGHTTKQMKHDGLCDIQVVSDIAVFVLKRDIELQLTN